MSIRFACPECNQRLSISSRKVGSQIKCPRCQGSVLVPDEAQTLAPARSQAASAEKSEAEASRGSALPKPPALPQFEDLPFLLAGMGTPGSPQPGRGRGTASQRAAGTSATPSKSAATAPLPGPVRVRSERPIDYGRVSIARWVLYAQGALILLVALAAFGAGFLIGRGKAGDSAISEAPQNPVTIGGVATYETTRGEVTPDAGAVIIAFPKGALPQQRISAKGLRPHDPAPPETHNGVRAIESLEAVYARADDSGQFQLTLRPGEYWTLAISKHAARPVAQSPSSEDTALLEKYFVSAPDLIGKGKYAWTLRKLAVGEPLKFDFGASGK
jgi:hypothetical protein